MSPGDSARAFPGHRLLAWGGVIVVAVILVSAGAELAKSHTPSSQGPPPGPPIEIHAYGLSQSTTIALSHAWVSVFSIVPDSIGGDPVIANDSQELLLFQGGTVGGVAVGNLAPQFATIAREWRALLSPFTSSVSLTIAGTYLATNLTTGQTDVYTAFNAYPYSPRDPPDTFAIPVFFDLARPTEVLPSAIAVSSPGVPASSVSPCTSTSVSWTTNYDSTIRALFPIAAVNNSDSSGSAYPEALVNVALWGTNVSLSFTESESVSSGVVMMSSGSSWGGNLGNISEGTAAPSSPQGYSNGTYSFGADYIDDVALNVLRQTETIASNGVGCVQTSTSLEYVWSSIVAVFGQTLELGYATLPSEFGQLFAQLNRLAGAETASNSTLPAGEAAPLSGIQNAATGYEATGSLLEKSDGASGYFETELDTGLAFSELAALCSRSCGASEVVDAITALGGALGFSLSMIDALSSIAYDTYSGQLPAILIDYEAYGGSFEFQLTDSSQPSALVTADGVSTANLPASLTAWAP
jgi:hypothetical protein